MSALAIARPSGATGLAKSARLMRALGPEAAPVWNELSPQEARALSAAMDALDDDLRDEADTLASYKQAHERTGALRFLFASRLLAAKGVGVFLEAARTIRDGGGDARFLIAGKPDPGNPDQFDMGLVEAAHAESAASRCSGSHVTIVGTNAVTPVDGSRRATSPIEPGSCVKS